jgi:hypothetical protein
MGRIEMLRKSYCVRAQEETEVVYGTGFIKSGRLSCVFGDAYDMIIPAAYFFQQHDHVHPRLPSYYDIVYVYVSNNGYIIR